MELEFSENRTTSIRISKDDYEIWKRSGMKATNVFSFGLRYNGLEYDLKVATETIKKLQSAIIKLQDQLFAVTDELDILKLSKENETDNGQKQL